MSNPAAQRRTEQRDGTTWIWLDSSEWLTLAREVRADGFVRCEWLTAVHNGAESFTVTACVSRDGIDQTIFCTTIEATINSLTEIWPNVEFHEREVRQMFGIQFINLNNPNSAFNAPLPGLPLRRDFALTPRVNQPWPGQVDPDKVKKPKLPPGVSQEWIQ
ncbi:MAG: NADH-quinone oxidoreductase subunit C [Actinomycetales bacterium]|nr:NADH-quinone oxidoreductase subunit C [Actinomycetales bacterium]